MFKALLYITAQVLLIQNISGIPIGALCNAPCASSFAPLSSLYGCYGSYNPATLAASNGGGLIVTSASPMEPIGVSVLSENVVEGALGVIGEVPFLGAITLEGALPTLGAGAVTYGCGNGAVAMVTEDYADAYNGYASPYNYNVYGYNGYTGYGIRFC
ncbi:unnamed protein product, partial [Brenthis ino]